MSRSRRTVLDVQQVARTCFVGPRLFAELLAIAVFALLLDIAGGDAAAQAPSDAMREEFEGWIQNVTTSDAHEYGALDNVGQPMGPAKIIQDPAGGYMAIYHVAEANGTFVVDLAISTDLMHWDFQVQLGTNASQPYLTYLPNAGFVAAWEQTPNNHIRFSYYTSRASLLAGVAAKTFDAPMTLSTCAEGTPSIYSATLSPNISQLTLDVGGHFYQNCTADREQRGVLTNFSSWSTSVQTGLDNAILAFGIQGNIGDRDAMNYRGYALGLVEGQFTSGDFGSWRIFCYDYQTGNADELHITTDGGSASFGNPRVTSIIAPNGKPAIVVTLFIFTPNNAPGEAGELIYYKTYDFTSAGGAVPVSLASAYNRTGMVSDGTTFEGGLDGSGNAYSDYLVGALPAWNVPPFLLGPVDSPNVVSAMDTTIPLPAGQFATLQMLGTGVNGSQAAQNITLTYLDNTTSTLTQSLSDWSTPQNFPGESDALNMAYFDRSSGFADNQTTYLYRYLFGLDSTKTVSSLTLPNDDNVEVVALTLVPTTGANFSLSSNSSSLSVAAGGTATSALTLTPSVPGGFTQPVSLTCSVASAGLACSMSPASVTPTFATLVALTVQAGNSAAPGTALVTVTGASGNLTSSTTLNLTVTPAVASYALSAGTASPALINPGGSSQATVTESSANGYTGTVTLACSVTLTVAFTPGQANCSFGNTSPVTVGASGGTAMMTFSTVAPSASMLRRSNVFYALLLPISGLALIGFGFGSGASGGKKLLGFLFLGIVLAGVTIMLACGGGSSGGGGSPGTPAGVYTVTITGKDANGAAPSNANPVTVTITVN